jgi:DNA-binding protein H-NS
MENLTTMTFDELLALKERVDTTLARLVDKRRDEITAQLARLNSLGEQSRAGRLSKVNGQPAKGRIVEPKYRNPSNPAETWAGRGLRPRWLVAAMKSTGKKLEHFAIRREVDD